MKQALSVLSVCGEIERAFVTTSIRREGQLVDAHREYVQPATLPINH